MLRFVLKDYFFYSKNLDLALIVDQEENINIIPRYNIENSTYFINSILDCKSC
uniref:Uncharacterized protein n=1 Tax=Rhizophagus irregularis (strain DAOM 181602 / DAOM 197198 / MUCL 43194) TaxID=747089 RepID=U9TP65_RHIID